MDIKTGLQEVARHLVADSNARNAESASAVDPHHLHAQLRRWLNQLRSAAHSHQSEEQVVPKTLGLFLCSLWSWLQAQQHRQRQLADGTPTQLLVAFTGCLQGSCHMFAHVLRFTFSSDAAAVTLRQPAVACLELIMRKGPMQTLFGQVEQFMKLQPCQPAAVAELQVVSTGRFGLRALLSVILTCLAMVAAYNGRPCINHFACSTGACSTGGMGFACILTPRYLSCPPNREQSSAASACPLGVH